MKNTAMILVVISTVILFSLGVLAALDFPFKWMFYLTCIGQATWIYTVYKVLTDNYTTEKTFDDWYEDKPIGNR